MSLSIMSLKVSLSAILFNYSCQTCPESPSVGVGICSNQGGDTPNSAYLIS